MAKVSAIDDNILKCTIENNEYVIMGDTGKIILNEDTKLPIELIKIIGNTATVQCFEDTSSVKTGMEVKFENRELAALLGPGLIGQIFDGLQNPLNIIADKYGKILPRGKEFLKLNDSIKWGFKKLVKVGDIVKPGSWLGEVSEFHFSHKIMVPFTLEESYKVKKISESGKYSINDTIAILEKDGKEIPVTMCFSWPVKKPFPKSACVERKKPLLPLSTGIRILDILIPICVGGTACVPGPFGAGKTVLQHELSKNAKVDIVIVAACGERAGEIVEVFQEFPELYDSTGKSLMDRTIIIGNTSSMPVAARESSIYLAMTIGEYYRAMGYNVLLLADSTSRWAQALREASGRLEEIPGEEAFPAYLESRIAEFYERAGLIKLHSGSEGSISVVGTVSPAGGNFQEPVTQATLATVGAFWGLSRARAEARKFPSIEPTESWARYKGNYDETREHILELLLKGKEVKEMIMVVGKEGVSSEDFIKYLKSEAIDKCVLQQNAFDEVDSYTGYERTKEVCRLTETLINYSPKITDKRKIDELFEKLTGMWINWNYTSEKEIKIYKEKLQELEIFLTKEI